MDKYPVFGRSRRWGTDRHPGGIVYGLFRLLPGAGGAVVRMGGGETGNLRIGVLEPENGCLQIRRRFSKRLTDPLGPILRGELRPLGEEREQWEPLRPELLRSPYLRCRLGGLSDVLTCRPERGRLIAVPRDDAAPFPLEAMFCFTRSGVAGTGVLGISL